MKRGMGILTLTAMWAIAGAGLAQGQPACTQSERGASVETPRYKAEFRNGLLVSLVNKLTQEEYCNRFADPAQIQPHLPSGLGTQGRKNEAMMGRAWELLAWPWWEHPADATWINQHYPDSASAFTFTAKGDQACVISYANLTDGTNRYAGDRFSLELAIDEKTGDLMVTPAGESDTPGVYAANFTCTALGSGITVEAPIMDGIRLGPDMAHQLWNNMWPGWWQFGFIALNGWKQGCFGIWCEDPELRMYKNFFYLINDQGLSFSLASLNIPPFEELRSARNLTWRIRPFADGWSAAAADYRAWRDANVKMPKRPDWTRNTSMVANETDGSPEIIEAIKKAFPDADDQKRVLTWACSVRKAGFDRNHSDNTPYAQFANDMKKWNAAQQKIIIYLQPMLMWKAPNGGKVVVEAMDEASKRAYEGATQQPLARTIFPFRDPLPKTKEESQNAKRGEGLDQTHLGHQRFRTWFFGWVDDYINKWGACGVYYDQAYHCSLDSRGLIDGTTSPQGMADWFRLSQEKWPEAAFASEMLNECNLTGCSFGIANPQYWGSMICWRWYRTRHASPVSAALCYPYAVRFDFSSEGDWQQDLHERRAQIPGLSVRWNLSRYTNLDTLQGWAWLQAVRCQTFVHYGLRPVFPVKWDDRVLSYYQGQHGEDFRYIRTGWGTAFVRVENGVEKTIFARTCEARYVPEPDGAVANWPLYVSATPYYKWGPAGMDPESYYIVDPRLKAPDFRFEMVGDQALLGLDRHVVKGFASDGVACMELQPTRSIMSASTGHIVTKFKEPPAMFSKDGAPSVSKPGTTAYIDNTARYACAMEKAPEPGLAALTNSLFVQGGNTATVRVQVVNYLQNPKIDKNVVVIRRDGPGFVNLYLPLRVPDDMPTGSVLTVSFTVGGSPTEHMQFHRKVTMRKNFAPVEPQLITFPPVKNPKQSYAMTANLPVLPGEIMLVSLHDFRGNGSQNIRLAWARPEPVPAP